MKTLPILLTVFAFSTLSPLAPRIGAAEAPKASILGRYAPAGQPENYLEFRADGTCILCLLGKPETVTYTVKGDDVTLNAPGRPPLPLKIVDGVLTLNGASWARVGDAAAAEAVAKAAAPDAEGPAKVAGHYVELRGNGATTYDLRADGTFTFTSHGRALANAKFTVKGADVFLQDRGGSHLRIAHGIMTDVDNDRKWKLVAATTPAGGATPPPPDAGAGGTGAPSGHAVAGGASAPAGKEPQAAAVAPPPAEGLSITLSAQGGPGARRHTVNFPEAQMPPNPQGYFWVVDRPDGQTKVTDLHHHEWRVANQAGVYRIHVEYRAGGVNKTVSNVLEITVPGR